MHFHSDLVCGECCCAVKVKKHHVVLSQQPCDRAASDVDVWLISEGYDTSLSHSKPPGRPQGCCRTVCPVIGHGTSLRAPTRGGLEVSRCAAVGALNPPGRTPMRTPRPPGPVGGGGGGPGTACGSAKTDLSNFRAPTGTVHGTEVPRYIGT